MPHEQTGNGIKKWWPGKQGRNHRLTLALLAMVQLARNFTYEISVNGTPQLTHSQRCQDAQAYQPTPRTGAHRNSLSNTAQLDDVVCV